MKIKNYLLMGVLTLVSLCSFGQDTYTYEYTGASETYTVPVGVTSIQIECWGAQGQALTAEDFDGSTGGLGGYAVGTLSVTPGEVITVFVGGTGTEGEGGFNGGGVGGFGTPSTGSGGFAGSGGGASDARIGGITLGDRIIVAGGGGGGGRDYVNGSCVPCGTGGNGGAGGGLIGLDGSDPADAIYGIYFNPGSGGSGGTGLAGGAGGDGPEGIDGNSGVLGIGGDGIDGFQSVASGGGGGGYYGGGAGAGAGSGSGAAGGGAAGGSSYIDGLEDAETTEGVREGNGLIILTELCLPLTVTASMAELCEGLPLTLTGTSDSGGEVTWGDPDITNGEPFILDESGTITYTATSDSEEDCNYEIEVLVHPQPELEASSDVSEICDGGLVTFTCIGADTYAWNYDAVNDVEYAPEMGPGEYEYEVIGTISEFGCADTVTLSLTIHALPEVIANADQEIYCDGDEITLTGSGAESYSWDMGVTDGESFTQDIGIVTYNVIGISAEGCFNTDSIDVIVVPNPEFTVATTDELFGSDGTAIITITVGEAPFTFDWSDDGTGDFDDDQDQDDLAEGTYTVILMDANGCTTEETVIINSQLGIENSSVSDIKIYPNPTNDRLVITRSGNFTIQLIALNGAVLLSETGSDQIEINLSDFANGVYLLELNQNGASYTTKVVKN